MSTLQLQKGGMTRWSTLCDARPADPSDRWRLRLIRLAVAHAHQSASPRNLSFSINFLSFFAPHGYDGRLARLLACVSREEFEGPLSV
jgi:hypothetical protein